MKDRERKRMKCLLASLTACLLVVSERGFTAEATVMPQDEPERNIISVELPVQEEDEGYPFDFILDPQALLYGTNAARYGGGTVEEGATLLFHNRGGAYDFSKTSDRLTVTNHGTGSVRVTVSAQVTGLGEISLLEGPDFRSNETCSIYLALTDSAGHVQPLAAEKETLLSYEMDLDTYSFGLTGACNSNADWEHTSVHPVVTIYWRVEALEMPQETILDEGAGETCQESDAAQTGIPGNDGTDVEKDNSGLQEDETGDKNTERESDGDGQDDQAGSGDIDIGENNGLGDTLGSEDADMERENAGTSDGRPGNQDMDIKGDKSESKENIQESGETEVEEKDANGLEDTLESEDADLGEASKAAQKGAAI